MSDIKLTTEQAELLEKLFDEEVDRDDPCINKRTKNLLVKQMKETLTIDDGWWYELMETIGCSDLNAKEQRIINPVIAASDTARRALRAKRRN